jgi:hypothetical protein
MIADIPPDPVSIFTGNYMHYRVNLQLQNADGLIVLLIEVDNTLNLTRHSISIDPSFVHNHPNITRFQETTNMFNYLSTNFNRFVTIDEG